jgi:predicted membrane GTPase involved in stress response
MAVKELMRFMSKDEVIEVAPLSSRLQKVEYAGVRERAARTTEK